MGNSANIKRSAGKVKQRAAGRSGRDGQSSVWSGYVFITQNQS